MIPVLNVTQMRDIDQAAIGGNVRIGFGYMLKAAMGLFESVRTLMPDPREGDIAIVCGKGNNGGDGYVAGSLLMDAGYRTMVFGLYGREALSGEAAMAFDDYAAHKGNVLVLDDIEELNQLPRYRVIIDAVLGSGIHGNPRGPAARAIEAINNAGRPVIAVDTPSGLDNDTGRPGKPCVRASATITMGFPKLGTLFYPGREFVGKLTVRDLGYPDEIVAEKQSCVFLPDETDFPHRLPPRKPAGSKIDHGLALMVCGSHGMYGAATLSCQAALRTGCGMVHAAVPCGAVDTLATKLTEVVLHSIDQTPQGSAAESAAETIVELSGRMQCACIGPGLSHVPQTSALVRKLVTELACPIVLDADGINAFKGCAEDLAKHQGALVLTPHAGEWARLFGELPPTPDETVERLKDVAAEYGVTVLLKGNPTLIAEPGHECFVLPVGNSGMASAGTGDVLTGIITSLVAQGATVTDAALLGAHIHGQAGDIAAQKLGPYAVIASDLVANLHAPLMHLAGRQTSQPKGPPQKNLWVVSGSGSSPSL